MKRNQNQKKKLKVQPKIFTQELIKVRQECNLLTDFLNNEQNDLVIYKGKYYNR